MVPLSSLTSIPAVKLYNGIGYLLIWENSEDQKIPFAIHSIIFQTKRNPRANADRFTNIPKTGKREKPTNLTKG
jgi:hypothetical protein